MAMMPTAIVLAILVDMVVSLVVASTQHREFVCQRKEHPIVTHRELKPFLYHFTFSNSGNFSQLVMDLRNDHLIVGGRNFLFKLNVSNLSLVQAVEWPSAQYTSCHNRGKTEEECQNYIRVLLPSNGKLFTCGTNAFAPLCIIRSMQDISKELDRVSGVARCPYDPQQSSTALLTVRGEIYAATAMDFSGRDPAIYRSLGSLPPLRTAQYNSRWLHEPSFVSVYEMGSFVYVFLRERPLQHECALSSISRVARICTNDVGGRFVLEETWTTFMKASLHCRLQTNSGLVTQAYPELQATYLLPERGLIYAVFSTSHAHGSVASALCAYNMSSVSAAFSGPFLQQENLHSAWSTQPNHNPNFKCGTLGKKEGVNANLTARSLVDAQRLLLMRDAVQPVDGGPLLHQENTRFTGIAVDEIIGQGPLHHVVFITTDAGSILRVSTPGPFRPGSACIMEEIRLSSPSLSEPVRSIFLHPEQGVLFLGLDSAVLRVQLRRCTSYDTLSTCIGAHDVYCGWDVAREVCTTRAKASRDWIQDLTRCPVRNQTVDGQLGSWSTWHTCPHVESGNRRGHCHCRHRACDQPEPRCGGRVCRGPLVEISNCSSPASPEGSWTSWDPWSSCSATCGTGIQVRRRTCTDRSKWQTGRLCMGVAREERLCHSTQHCSASRVWSTWGPWGHCNSPCGGGVHTRRRICSHVGSCYGCDVENKPCKNQPCADAMVTTPWGQWMTENSLFQQRWRHTCLAERLNSGSLKLGPRQVEMRFCSDKTPDATCPPNTELQFEAKLEPGWSSWSPWESCSRSCGLGFRVRRRDCTPAAPTRYLTPACLGPSTQFEECRLQLCAGEGGWTCWSAWSTCSGPCSLSLKTRSRHCTIAEDSRLCVGPPDEKESCRMQGCPGDWNTWGSWSQCDWQMQQHRTRVCTTTSHPPEQCMGTAFERRQCIRHPNTIPDDNIDFSARLTSVNGGFTLGHVVAASLSCGLAACLLTVLAFSFCQAKLPSLTTHSGTAVTSVFSRNSSCPCHNRKQVCTLKGYHDVRRKEMHSSLESKLNTFTPEPPADDTTSNL